MTDFRTMNCTIIINQINTKRTKPNKIKPNQFNINQQNTTQNNESCYNSIKNINIKVSIIQKGENTILINIIKVYTKYH